MTLWGEDCSVVAPVTLRNTSPRWDTLEITQPRTALPGEFIPSLLCLVIH